jgi:4-hydroxy-4-methyl-2-oxoglutarate aldolase
MTFHGVLRYLFKLINGGNIMKIKNFSFLICLSLSMAGLFMHSSVSAQPSSLTKEEMIQYTPMWNGERFADGRPKVSDDLVARMKYVSVTEAWGTLTASTDDTTRRMGMGMGRGETYAYQYYGGFKPLYDNVTICGRVSTIQYMPFRPDVASALTKQAAKDGKARTHITWGIDQLVKGDVYVANVCEGILDASSVGDNMATTIFTKSGNGAIIRGTVRDVEGNMQIKGWNVFARDFRPESNNANMVIGVNGPIQIGYVTVMPGDIVLAKREGVIFIPAHLAKKVVESSEKTRMQDVFAHNGVKEGRFTAGQADGGFTDSMNKEFDKWLLDNADTMGKFFDDPKAAPSPEFIRAYVKERQARPPMGR